jgi:dihydroxyacetone kinase-like predicted kinase
MKSQSSSEIKKPELEKCVNLDGFTLAALFKAGTLWVKKHIEELNSIDVFPPPPSGSAGTRIYLTMLAGCKETKAHPDSTASEVAHAFSLGTLLGARGHQ